MLEQAIYLKQNVNFFFVSSDTSQTGKVPRGNLPLNASLLVESVWKFPNDNFSSVHQITKHQHSHFERQHESTIFVTNQNIHYTLLPILPMAHPGRVYWKADAPKSQDCCNPLTELAMVLYSCPLFSGFCTYQGRCEKMCVV